jgi:Domain of unknown function (DUF4091)
MKRATSQSPVVREALRATMNRLFTIFLLCLALPALAPAQDPLSPANLPAIDTNAGHYPSNIWITDTMQKVRQDSGSPGSVHWGTFYGTQNEFVDFQIHFHDTAAGTANLSVTASDFVQTSPASFTISAASKNIIVYRERYMNVTTKTATGPAYYNTTGLYPDALIPAVDPYFNQTTNAWPFTVAPNQNQSAWIDVHVPPNAPSGYYLGSVTVKSGGTTLATMPVIIAVWQWPSGGAMPSTSSLPTEYQFGVSDFCNQVYGGSFGSGCGPYPGAGGSGDLGVTISDADGASLMLDHRISMYDPVYGNSGRLTTYYEPQFAGTSGHVSTILPGAKATGVRASISTFGTYQGWATHFAANAGAWPSVVTMNYDNGNEPSNWSAVLNSAATAHGLTPPMPYMATTDIVRATNGGALTSIDIMVVPINTLEQNGDNGPTGLTRSQYNTWLSGSTAGITRRIWSYLACGSGGTCGNGTVGNFTYNYPNYNIDAKPASNRAQEWMTYLHNQSGELYYYATCAWETGCYGAGLNPWTNLYAFGNNGDGTLLYPGSTAQVGTATPIWIPSIRLKNIRDGLQDYEYLNVLTVSGKGGDAMKQVTGWITNSYSYEYSGTGLQTARFNLGTTMHQLTFATSLLPPPTLRGTVQ